MKKIAALTKGFFHENIVTGLTDRFGEVELIGLDEIEPTLAANSVTTYRYTDFRDIDTLAKDIVFILQYREIEYYYHAQDIAMAVALYKAMQGTGIKLFTPVLKNNSTIIRDIY